MSILLRKIVLLWCFLLTCGIVRGQGLTGRVTDSDGSPVSYVTVIMNSSDSVFIAAELTDSQGAFHFARGVPPGTVRLLFQHLAYHPHEIEWDAAVADVGAVVIREKENTVDRITVWGERPLVTVEGSTLSYDAQYVARGKAVSTAFDVLKELPGMVGYGDELQLAGSGGFTVIINGQVSSLSMEQVMTMLKSLPASTVKKLEVSYTAPAKYNIKGAVINVVLDDGAGMERTMQGEVAASYIQAHHALGNLRGSMLYKSGKFSLDASANLNKGSSYSRNETFSRHTVPGHTADIDQLTRGRSEGERGNFRLGGDYRFRNEGSLSFSYYYEGVHSNSESNAETGYTEAGVREAVVSRNRHNGGSQLHNLHLQYDGPRGLMAGADYLRYASPDKGSYADSYPERLVEYRDRTSQYVSRVTGFVNRSHDFNKGWKLTYGVNAVYGQSDNKVRYLFPGEGGFVEDHGMRVVNRQEEYTGNFFAEVSGNIGSRFSGTVGLKGEYFRSDYFLNGAKSVLWNEWTFFPTASLTYVFAPSHILQLGLSSDKSYPPYWAVSPQVTPMNSYMEARGNPELKPAVTYQGQLVYILKQKYTFLTYVSYTPDRFAQIPYQEAEELKMIYRFENFDYSLQAGVAAILPFNIARRWNLRLTLYGIGMKEKMKDFYGESFVNDCIFGMFSVGNSVTLSEKPNISLQLDAMYRSDAIQGIYTLGASYDMAAGLKWTLANGSYLALRYDNILRRQTPQPIKVDWKNQYNSMKIIDYATFTATFAWRFGNYKEKQYKTVDKSRLGR